MPQIEHLSKVNSRHWRRIAVVLFVLVIFLGGFLYGRQRQIQAQKEFEQVIKLAQQQQAKNNFATAKDILTHYIAEKPRSDYEGKAWQLLGGEYINLKQYRDAINAYQMAIKFNHKESLIETIGIAVAAEKTGDKSLSLGYYKKTVALIKSSNDQGALADLSYYQDKVNSLSGAR